MLRLTAQGTVSSAAMPASCIKDVAEVGGDVPTIKECRIKNNLPITLTERFPDAAKPIVTKTDLQGRITYANESFVAISGFGREELIGESHNIVRHPDMPKAAFADLWRTIKADQPWRGIVKNRCKNGDYYWVDAYVTPVTENGRTTGYMSVRTLPSRTDVAATEALYRQVQSGSATLPATEFPASMARADLAFWLVAIGSGGLALAGAALGGTTGFACAAAAAAVGLAQAALVRTRFVNPLRELDAIIRAIDEGQLGRRISARGAVASTFSRLEALRIHLRAIFADVLVSSREVDARARAMDEAMQALVSGAEVQMDRIQQVAAAMQQLSVSIDEISSSTAAGMDASIRTENAAKAGIVGIETCIDSSRRVADVVADSKEKIGDVNAAVARISDISRVIKEIAAQTNLLALNAAIEAARAGDQGRGFAVVADEVRKLAESTESSIGEISGVVGTVAESSGTAAVTMVKVAKEVDQSASLVADNGETLKMIWQNSQEVARSSREIADMLSQQTSTTHEIALNMERIATAVEAGNGNVAKVGQAARRLRETSENLRLLVAHMESAIS